MSKTARPTELKVKVISAKNLIAADSNGKSDPFAVVLTKSGSSGKDKSIKTKKISETLNPTWNETFNLILRDRKDSLLIEVWDDDLFGKDHLGTAEISLEGLEHEKETPLVAKLNKQGEVSVALTIRYNDKEIEEFVHKQEEEKKRLAAEAQKKKEEEEKRLAAEEAARKQKEEEAKKIAAEAQKKKEEEEKKQAAEAQKKKEEEERKKKEEEQKKAQQAAQVPAKAASAPATPAASSPVPPAAKASSAPATPATSTPAKPATTSPASTTKASTPTTPAKQATKQAEGPNYALIGGVVAVLAVAGFAAFKYLHKN